MNRCKHCWHKCAIDHDYEVIKMMEVCCTCGTIEDRWWHDYKMERYRNV